MTEKVKAEVIDSPSTMSGAEKWLANVSDKVSERAKEYMPRKIESGEDYKQCKRERTALRKDIAEIDSERKAMTRDIKDAVRKFELGCKDVLTPLTDMESEYKKNIDDYEKYLIGQRKIALAKEYAEIAPDLVPLVPFDRLCDKFAADGKWFAFSTGDVKASQLMCKAVETIAADEGTISYATEGPEEEAEVKAEYFTTLDMSTALKNCLARREQRKRVEELERQRAEYAAQEQQDSEITEAEPEPVELPEEHEPEPQIASERVIVFEVTVPESKVQAFRSAMIEIGGIHGRVVR